MPPARCARVPGVYADDPEYGIRCLSLSKSHKLIERIIHDFPQIIRHMIVNFLLVEHSVILRRVCSNGATSTLIGVISHPERPRDLAL